MPVIDPDRLAPTTVGSDYPAPYDREVAGRIVRDLASRAGATDWIANHVVIPPGGWSSQRHWHEGEDEIVVVLAGEGVMIDDKGRHPMTVGEVAIFRKGDGNGHHLVNESDAALTLLALSLPEASVVHYSDIDLRWSPDDGDTHRDGTPY